MLTHLKEYKVRYSVVVAILTIVLSYLGIDKTEQENILKMASELVTYIINSAEVSNE